MNHRTVFGLVGILTVGSPIPLNTLSCVATTYTIHKYGNSSEGVAAAKEIHEKTRVFTGPLAEGIHTILLKPGEELSYWLHK